MARPKGIHRNWPLPSQGQKAVLSSSYWQLATLKIEGGELYTLTCDLVLRQVGVVDRAYDSPPTFLIQTQPGPSKDCYSPQ